MAHFAQLDQNNVVTEVIVVNNATIDNLPFPESEPVGVAFCQSLYGVETVWAQTSYNATFRYNYAGNGYIFYPDATPDGAFSPPQPYPSWILNTSTYQWEAPVPYPDDGKLYYWDEATLSWVLVEPQPE
jgi:hypothetical protein